MVSGVNGLKKKIWRRKGGRSGFDKQLRGLTNLPEFSKKDKSQIDSSSDGEPIPEIKEAEEYRKLQDRLYKLCSAWKKRIDRQYLPSQESFDDEPIQEIDEVDGHSGLQINSSSDGKPVHEIKEAEEYRELQDRLYKLCSAWKERIDRKYLPSKESSDDESIQEIDDVDEHKELQESLCKFVRREIKPEQPESSGRDRPEQVKSSSVHDSHKVVPCGNPISIGKCFSLTILQYLLMGMGR